MSRIRTSVGRVVIQEDSTGMIDVYTGGRYCKHAILPRLYVDDFFRAVEEFRKVYEERQRHGFVELLPDTGGMHDDLRAAIRLLEKHLEDELPRVGDA